MDDDRLNGSLRQVVSRALDLARSRGSNTVEAEHLLLALAADRRSFAAQLLDSVGLDQDSIDEALRDERTRSLAAAGVAPVAEAALTSTPRTQRPTLGASARDAFVRSHRVIQSRRDREPRGSAVRRPRDNRHHRADDTDLLLGILRAELGTVPRALAIAGIDRAGLVEQWG